MSLCRKRRGVPIFGRGDCIITIRLRQPGGGNCWSWRAVERPVVRPTLAVVVIVQLAQSAGTVAWRQSTAARWGRERVCVQLPPPEVVE